MPIPIFAITIFIKTIYNVSMKDFLDSWGVRLTPYVKHVPVAYLICYIFYAAHSSFNINIKVILPEFNFNFCNLLFFDLGVFFIVYLFFKYYTKRPLFMLAITVFCMLVNFFCGLLFSSISFVKNYFIMLEKARIEYFIPEANLLKILFCNILPIIFAIKASLLLYKLLIQNKTIPKIRQEMADFIVRDMARLAFLIYTNLKLYSYAEHNVNYSLADFYFDYFDFGVFITLIGYVLGLPYICLYMLQNDQLKTFDIVPKYK